MSRIVRIEIDLDKNKTRTFVNEDMPEQQKKDILKYINKEGKYSLNRIVKGINIHEYKYYKKTNHVSNSSKKEPHNATLYIFNSNIDISAISNVLLFL